MLALPSVKLSFVKLLDSSSCPLPPLVSFLYSHTFTGHLCQTTLFLYCITHFWKLGNLPFNTMNSSHNQTNAATRGGQGSTPTPANSGGSGIFGGATVGATHGDAKTADSPSGYRRVSTLSTGCLSSTRWLLIIHFYVGLSGAEQDVRKLLQSKA